MGQLTQTARDYRVSEATIHCWRARFGGMEISEVRRLKELEAEPRRLQRIVAQQAMAIDALKELLRENGKP